MSLVKLRLTPRKLAANRANALKSTGPRTRAGKMRSRLNALRAGTSSQLHDRYFRLWLQICAHGPLRPPAWWKFRDMPVPVDSHRGDLLRGARIRELLWRARHHLPLGKRRRSTRADFDAARRPALQWGKLTESFSGGESHQVIENRWRGVGQIRAKYAQTNP